MAELVFKNAYLMINSVDLSAHVKQVSIDYSADMADAAAMGDNSKKNLPGLLNWPMKITFKQDFASGKVDATMFPLVGAAAFTVKLRPVNGAISATNPEYRGDYVVSSYSPISGSHGELLVTEVSLEPGDGDLVRATS